MSLLNDYRREGFMLSFLTPWIRLMLILICSLSLVACSGGSETLTLPPLVARVTPEVTAPTPVSSPQPAPTVTGSTPASSSSGSDAEGFVPSPASDQNTVVSQNPSPGSLGSPAPDLGAGEPPDRPRPQFLPRPQESPVASPSPQGSPTASPSPQGSATPEPQTPDPSPPAANPTPGSEDGLLSDEELEARFPDLPPEPDPELNNQTIAGIDLDGDELRDDVQRYIYKRFPDDDQGRNALLRYAIAQQNVLLTADDREASIEATRRAFKTWECISWIFVDSRDMDIEIPISITNEILIVIENTKERVIASLKSDHNFSGQTYFLPPESTSQSCNE